ncbi:MAG: dCTP deaminase [Caulobacteraceae bacterium]|nr:dCTP deaminase [Caulobacteraceae bacterium]
MILTDREIKISIQEGLIELDPPPAPDAYSSTSVDLKLDPSISEFVSPSAGLRFAIDPSAKGYSFKSVIEQITRKVTISDQTGYELAPNSLILAWTNERVNLRASARVAARVEGKSSLARIGLAIHVTAPTIHAGFEGQIQLEVVNHGPLPIVLRPGMRVCQLIFELTLGVPERGYGGQFAAQTSAERFPG